MNNESLEQKVQRLIAQYQQDLYWHIRRMVVCHEDAQDILQETFIKAYRKIDTLKNDGAERVWIYRIATNESIMWIRKRDNRNLLNDLNVTDTEDIAASDYIDISDKTLVKLQKAILSLPNKQQLVFNMRYYDEMTFKEIAAITDMSENTAKVNYHIAKEKISKIMINESWT